MFTLLGEVIEESLDMVCFIVRFAVRDLVRGRSGRLLGVSLLIIRKNKDTQAQWAYKYQRLPYVIE